MAQVCLAATLGLLTWKLSQLGWIDIWRHVPTAPGFYALCAASYLLLPFSEAITFRLCWPFAFWRSQSVFYRKHVYNHDVVDYSGEVYLYLWATQRLRLSESFALLSIKDNAILSSLAGLAMALSTPWAAYACGQLAPQLKFSGTEILMLEAGPVVAIVVCALAFGFRRLLFSLPLPTLLATGGIHLARFMAINLLTVLQWKCVMPAEPLAVWCTLLSVQNLIGRLPSFTRREFLFVAAGVELSQAMSAPAAAMAGMLLVNSVLEKAAGALIVGVSLLLGRKGSGKVAEPVALDLPAASIAGTAPATVGSATSLPADDARRGAA